MKKNEHLTMYQNDDNYLKRQKSSLKTTDACCGGDLCCSLPPGGDQDVTFGIAWVTTAVSDEVSAAGNTWDNGSTQPHRIYK